MLKRGRLLSLPLLAGRLTPAARGNVGASRGEVDAGLLNAFVLAVEQVRGCSFRAQAVVLFYRSFYFSPLVGD